MIGMKNAMIGLGAVTLLVGGSVLVDSRISFASELEQGLSHEMSVTFEAWDGDAEDFPGGLHFEEMELGQDFQERVAHMSEEDIISFNIITGELVDESEIVLFEISEIE